MRMTLMVVFFKAFGVCGQAYHLENYNINRGLAQSQVQDMTLDRRGFLWVGTQGGGVSVFDGSKFTNTSFEDGLLSNNVTSLLEDHQGTMWLGHDEGGLTWYDGRNFNATRIVGGLKMEGKTSLVNLKNGNMLAGCAGTGLREFDGKAWKALTHKDGLLSDTVLDIFAFDKGAYIATSKGICVYQDGRFSEIVLKGLPPNSGILAIGLDSEGSLLLGITGQVFHQKGDSVFLLPAVTNVGDVRDIFLDRKGAIWVAGSGAIVTLADTGVVEYDRFSSLWNSGAFVTIEDHFGNIWIGTDGQGAFKLSEEAWTMYGEGTPFENRAVFAIEETGPDSYLVGTERGLFHLENGNVLASSDPVLKDFTVYDILITEDRKTQIVMGGGGLVMCKGGKCTNVGPKSRLGKATAFMAVEDIDSTIWVATSRGVFVLDEEDIIDLGHLYPRFGQPFNQIFIDSKGTKWFVPITQGVIRWKHRQQVEEITLPGNFANNRIMAVTEDPNGNIWFGTRSGIMRWGDNGCYLTAREGLLGSIVYVMQRDTEGNLWIGTERGLNKIILNHDSDVMEIKTYGVEEGFRGQECNQQANLVDTQGKLWVGTVYGLCRYDPDFDIQPDILPKLTLLGLRLNLEEVDWEGLGFDVQPWTQMPINLDLGPDQNHLRFDFKATTMWRPDKLRYKYILEGLQDQWSKPDPEGHAVYAALPPGEYTFKVKACDAAGRWTEAVGFSFKIRSPFYKSGWFIASCLLLIFGTLLLVFRIRLRNAHRISERLEAKVRERTEELENANRVKGEFLAKMSHEIRTPMNGVIGMTELLRRTELDDRQLKFVDNIRVSGKNLLTLINDILDFSRIESGKIELEHTALDLRGLVEEVLDILAYSAYDKGLELLVWVDPSIRGPVVGDPARLKQVLLNLVGNAIKFTQQGRVRVQVDLKDVGEDFAKIQFGIHDSGIGIPKEKHATIFDSFTQVDASTTRKFGGTGLGLAISHSLVNMMGGEMWVESEPGSGASFMFTVAAGLSGPWKSDLAQHPAQEIKFKRVGVAVADPEGSELLRKYFEHWGLEMEAYPTIEALGDAILGTAGPDFVLLDTRVLPESVSRQTTIAHFSALCARAGKRYALLCDPALSVELQLSVGDNGWLVPKPWKRDDLLRALLGDRKFLQARNVLLSHDIHLAERMPIDILIAEDNPINVEVCVGMLSNFGYSARVAENGEEAVEAVRKQIPDVVFMDVQMPKMDGLAATRVIVAEFGERSPKIVAMTANAMESDRQACLQAGMNQFISKPFATEELLQMLHWVTGKTLDETRRAVEPVPAPLAAANPEAAVEVPVVEAATGSAPQLLNLSMLEAASGGDPMFVMAILSKMSKKMPEAMLELRASMEKGEWDNVRAVAHRTKSSAAYTGAEILRTMFKEMEHAAMDPARHGEIPAMMDEVEALMNQIVGEINQELEKR